MRKKREGSLGLVSSRILCENVFSLRLSVCAAFPVSLDPHAHEVLTQTRVEARGGHQALVCLSPPYIFETGLPQSLKFCGVSGLLLPPPPQHWDCSLSVYKVFRPVMGKAGLRS